MNLRRRSEQEMKAYVDGYTAGYKAAIEKISRSMNDLEHDLELRVQTMRSTIEIDT